MEEKEVFIFPYINISSIIKMGDFEIHPYKDYNFSKELIKEEKDRLDEYVYSFRETFFKKGEYPKVAKGIGILKYNGTILRTIDNTEGLYDKIKILFLLLKLHVSHDFFNPGMNHINIKSFDIFGFNLKNNLTNKFGNMHECNQLHSTIPENINGLGNIKFYPLNVCVNKIPVELKVFKGGDEIFGINPKITDITYLYNGIIKNNEYYQKFLNIASINYGLEQQNDLFFYYSIIPSIIEVLSPPGKENKKVNGIDYGIKLDQLLILNNDKIETIVYRNGNPNKEKLGLLARTIFMVYDTRNYLLHEGKKSFDRLKVNFEGYDLRIYDVFQLIFKYSILNDFIEQGIINNNFSNLEIEGNMYTTGKYEIKSIQSKLYMDGELEGLLEKAKSDKELGIS